jgi:hypothetical protein
VEDAEKSRRSADFIVIYVRAQGRLDKVPPTSTAEPRDAQVGVTGGCGESARA